MINTIVSKDMAVELGNKNYPQKKQVHEGCSKEFAASLTLFLISKPKLRMQRICLDTSRGSRCRKGMRSLIHFSVAPSAERGIVAFVGLARRVRAAVAIISRLLESHCVVGRLIVGASCPIREYPAASPSAAAVILFLSRRDFAARDRSLYRHHDNRHLAKKIQVLRKEGGMRRTPSDINNSILGFKRISFAIYRLHSFY